MVALLERDAMTFDHGDKIVLRILRQRRAAKMRILGEKVSRAHLAVGEIAAPAAGDANALAELVGMFDQQHPPPTLPRLRGAHHAGRACADDDDVKIHPCLSSRIHVPLQPILQQCQMPQFAALNPRVIVLGCGE